jgi:hypothetical protein
MMTAANADRGDLAPSERSRLWWFEWPRRTETGAIGASRVRYPISAMNSPVHDRGDAETSRARAGARTEPKDEEGVPDATLGTDWGRRLLHRGSVDPARAAAVHRAVLHRTVDAQGPGCGHRDPLFTAEFLSRLADVGVKSVKLVGSMAMKPWPRLVQHDGSPHPPAKLVPYFAGSAVPARPADRPAPSA